MRSPKRGASQPAGSGAIGQKLKIHAVFGKDILNPEETRHQTSQSGRCGCSFGVLIFLHANSFSRMRISPKTAHKLVSVDTTNSRDVHHTPTTSSGLIVGTIRRISVCRWRAWAVSTSHTSPHSTKNRHLVALCTIMMVV